MSEPDASSSEKRTTNASTSEKAPASEKAPDSALNETPPTSLRVVPSATKNKIERRVFWACVWSLLALCLIVWSLVDPKPIPVIVAMSVGQVVGTLALLLFLGSVALDVRARYIIERRTKPPPSLRPRS